MNNNINVLHIITGDEKFWGVERYILNLSQAAAKYGVNSSVVTQHDVIAEKYNELGVSASKISMRGYLDQDAVRQIRDTIQQKNIDVVHSHMGLDSFLAASAISSRKAKHVSSVHFLEPSWATAPLLKREIWRCVQRLKNTKIDRFVPITPQVSANLQKREGISEEKISIVYPGVAPAEEPLSKSEARAALGLGSDELVIATVARLTPEKNVASAIRACAQLRKTVPQFKLLVAGDGDQRGFLEGLIAEYNLADNIALLGYQSNVRPLLYAADLFLFTSIAEGFGIASVEAMFAGLPIVGWSGVGLDFIVEHEKTGLLVNHGDESALATKIEQLTSNTTLRLKMGESGRLRAQTLFSVERMAQEMVNVYRKTLRLE